MRNGSWDAIVIGAGIIGISLAIELRKSLRKVLVMDRTQPGREASYAAAGMLNIDSDVPPALRSFARHSAAIYPLYIEEVRSRSRSGIDFQRTGAIVLGDGGEGAPLDPIRLRDLELGLATLGLKPSYVQEDFVAPRTLMLALAEHAEAAGITMESDNAVMQIAVADKKCTGVRCANGSALSTSAVINCAGAWAAQITGGPVIPTRPVKGQMLALDPGRPMLRHVVRYGPSQVYMLPRATGAIAIGATVEEVGFDRSTTEDALRQLRIEATKILPALAAATVHESWAGLRPGSPDAMPIMGETSLSGYYAATGHFRHGILLAPATAEAMAQLIVTGKSDLDITSFSPQRFTSVRNGRTTSDLY